VSLSKKAAAANRKTALKKFHFNRTPMNNQR
jgi:hypothetical protein